ncbi:glycerate kinase [Jackrogersella minutella]|nr:glycerate kinase [Jackrogersella minutella]
MRPLNILLAPSGFHNTLSASAVADCLEAAINVATAGNPPILRKFPLCNYRQDFSRTLQQRYGWTWINMVVMGPYRDRVEAGFWKSNTTDTAFLDVEDINGSKFLPANFDDSTNTTSYGVGQVIQSVLDAGCNRIIVIGGYSIAFDGGAGMLQALGAKLLDANGKEMGAAPGGPELSRLVDIDMSGIHPELRTRGAVRLETVYYSEEVLCGPNGVALGDGPQRDASMEQIEDLTFGLEAFGLAASKILHEVIQEKPRSGISGGLGSGLMLLNSHFLSSLLAADMYFDLPGLIDETPWDLLITGAGYLSTDNELVQPTLDIMKVARDRKVRTIVVVGLAGDGVPADTVINETTTVIQIPGRPQFSAEETQSIISMAVDNCIRTLYLGMSFVEDVKENGVQSDTMDTT